MVNHAKDSSLTANHFDDHHLFATLVYRYVRVTCRSSDRALPGAATPAPAVASARDTTSSRIDANQPRVIPDAGWPESVSILFAEAVCRRVHAMALEARQHECHQRKPVSRRGSTSAHCDRAANW
jgi:hypothetical protein